MIFLTTNSSDFGSGDYILEEYGDQFCRPENFRIITSISKFNDEFIIPKLNKLEKIRLQLQNNEIRNFEIKDWVNIRLKNKNTKNERRNS